VLASEYILSNLCCNRWILSTEVDGLPITAGNQTNRPWIINVTSKRSKPEVMLVIAAMLLDDSSNLLMGFDIHY
jgi:hypothetical protein